MTKVLQQLRFIKRFHGFHGGISFKVKLKVWVCVPGRLPKLTGTQIAYHRRSPRPIPDAFMPGSRMRVR
jgi:hypothetical protein